MPSESTPLLHQSLDGPGLTVGQGTSAHRALLHMRETEWARTWGGMGQVAWLWPDWRPGPVTTQDPAASGKHYGVGTREGGGI